MLLQKVLNILTMMPAKHQKVVMAQVDFVNNPPSVVYHNIIDTMMSVCKNAQNREILEIYSNMPVTDEMVLEAFGGANCLPTMPLTFSDDQIEYIRENVYRNRNGKFRIIPRTKSCSLDSMPLDGLDADEEILSSKLTTCRLSMSGSSDTFDGLRELRRQPYDGPYDGVYKALAPNIKRINIISSFEKDDPHGFFTRDNAMYRNICSQMATPDPSLVNDKSLRRAMLLLYMVSGGSVREWELLYNVIHFMVRVPNSSTGYILYLNDFDAGGNGKSKLVSVLQHMFADSFTAFSPQQLRFTMSLMGKRLVSISEYEDTEASKPLQGLLKSMTGRDRFQYEGKGQDPIVADTYQNFIISSNRYIHFEDNGIKRRLQNFHCSNLLHVLLNKYCKTYDYLDDLFGNVFNGDALRITKEMAHSLLDYIMKDTRTYSIPIRPQHVVLGSIRNPVLRNLFSTHIDCDAFIRETKDGSAIDLFRIGADARPEQLNYAATTLQSWLPEINFTVSRDSTTMTCSLTDLALSKALQSRLSDLDETSRQLRTKHNVRLELGRFDKFDVGELIKEFLGDTFERYDVPLDETPDYLTIG